MANRKKKHFRTKNLGELYLKIEGFHWAALANMTDEQPVSWRYFSISLYVFTSSDTPFAITGMETALATSRMTLMCTGSRERSCFSLRKISIKSWITTIVFDCSEIVLLQGFLS